MVKITQLPTGLRLTADQPEREVLHQPFTMFGNIPVLAKTEAHAAAGLAGRTSDIAAGVMAVLAIVEEDMANKECADLEDRPLPQLVGANVTGRLMRLCIASLDMLSQEACRYGDRLVEQSAKEGTNGRHG